MSDHFEYFLGIGLPEKESVVFTEVKEFFHPNNRISSPPHITLIPPFPWQNEAELIGRVGKWAERQDEFEGRFYKVGSFKQRDYGTVFLSPDSGEEFRKLASSLNSYILRSNTLGSYVPHLTVAQKVPHGRLKEVKQKIREMNLELELKVDRVILYRHKVKEAWEAYREFLFVNV